MPIRHPQVLALLLDQEERSRPATTIGQATVTDVSVVLDSLGYLHDPEVVSH